MRLPSVPQNIPQHLAIIMDGNGRWAKRHSLPKSTGYQEGVKCLRQLIEHVLSEQIQILTVYAFSSENWRRPATEVNMLLDLFMRALQREVDTLHEHQIRLRFIGDITRFSKRLQQAINDAQELTFDNNRLMLNIAVNYGGRWDILNACRGVLQDMRGSDSPLEALDEEKLSGYFALHDLPAPDLLIRTGGEQRLSNFMLWQMAYTELYFTDCLWPDFSLLQLREAVTWYANRQRRFGHTEDQMHTRHVS